MHDYSRSLGVAVRKARNELGLTQVKLAEMTGVESRTIINIEGCEGNPMLENLYPLIRILKIDPWEVFYPELQQRDAAFRQLQLLLKECSDEEIASLLPICQATLSVLKSKGAIQIESDRACILKFGEAGSALYASGSLLSVIIN